MRNVLIPLAMALAIGLPPIAQARGLSGAYLAARQASISGDFAAAATYYDRAIQFDPARLELLERATLANLALGQIDQAAVYAQALEDSGGRSQVAQMALFTHHAAEENYAEVLARLDKNLGVGPLVDGLTRAWSLLGQGDMSAALVAFDEVGKDRGLGIFALYHKALALASVGDMENADAILSDDSAGSVRATRRAVMAHVEILSQLQRNDDGLTLIEESFGGRDLDPALRDMTAALEAGEVLPFTHVTNARDGLAEVFFSLAGALINEADREFILLYSRVAQHLRPDHVDAILLTAELLEQLDQLDLAVSSYKKVPRDNPAYHAAELGRAGALRRDGREDAAIEVLEQLAQTHGDQAIVHSTLGDTLRSAARFQEAAQAYDSALALVSETDRRQWFLYYARGITHERLDNWDQAESDFRRALDLNPEQPQVLNYLGYSLVEKQVKLDEALDMIQRAVAQSPDSGYIVDSLGWVLYRLGRYDEAVGHMERATELEPVDPIVNDHLGDVYWAVGRKMEAAFQWKRALSFIDYGSSSEEADPDRIRRKLEVGLDQVLQEEGAPPLQIANDGN